MKKTIIALGLALCALTAAPAEDYPSHTIRLIVPFTPGGASDIMARVIGQKLTLALGQAVVVDNRPGAGGNLGTEIGARAPADGYTLLLGSAAPLVVSPATFKSLPYDPLRDFAPITLIANTPLLIGAGKELAANDLREFVAAARKQPGFYTFGTGSSTLNLTAELLKSIAKIDLLGVQYRGVVEATTDVTAGRVSITINTVGAELPNLQSGRLKALAVLSKQRVDSLPDVATSAELGFPELQVDGWASLMAPANTPPAIIDRLHREVAKILDDPQTRKQFEKLGFDVAPGKPEQLRALMEREIARWKKVVRDARIELQ